MSFLKEFATWFFETPTPFIAFISAIIAGLVFRNQRRAARKNHAADIAQKYSREIIPRIRYINKVLSLVGAQKHMNGIGEFKDFSVSELDEHLKHINSSSEEILNTFKTIDQSVLENAFANSGCGTYMLQYHKSLLYTCQKTPTCINESFRKFVFDLLNDLEAFAILFRYNIAEEAMVYPVLHQTFLRNMQNWYFFISYRNQIDHDRYYINIIWLYKRWQKQKMDRKKHFEKISWKERSKKL